MKMQFSASSMAWTCTMPKTVQRWMVNTAWATGRPGAPMASRSAPVASTMLSLMVSGMGSVVTSSSLIWIEPTMLCSMRSRARTLLNSRLGSAGRRGWQSLCSPQPGTSVQWRMVDLGGAAARWVRRRRPRPPRPGYAPIAR